MQLIYQHSIEKKLKILIFLVSTITILFAQPNLELKLSQDTQKSNTGEITVSIMNDSNESINVLKWNTPFEKILSANIFKIQNGKKTIKYIGRIVKRLHPQNSDYITLQAGEKHTVVIDLVKYYNLQDKGMYTIDYSGSVKAINQRTQEKIDNIFSEKNVTTLGIDFTPPQTQKKTSTTTYSAKNDPSFNQCTQSEIDTLNTAHDAAISIAENASDTMNSADVKTSGDRYRIWFGAADNSRQNKVTTHFENIYSALDTKDVTFDCSCDEDFFAYVYPNEPYTVYLCNVFWDAEVTGTDSQAGTLVHEMAHFDIVADTSDFAYGHNDSKDLAVDDPQKAIFNSDNHEYFAENTPSLDMSNMFDNAFLVNNIIGDLPISENISVSGESDIYKFTAQNTGIYTFYTSGSLDSYGSVYSDTYVRLIKDDDSGDSRNFELLFTLQQGQTYYIEVREYDAKTGDYTLHSSFYVDTDNDGIGNNTDTDDDNDGVLDENDAFPLDASESVDTDHDGIGNNADRDDDNDGISDTDERTYGLNPLKASDAQADFDGDGFSNIIEISVGSNLRSAKSHPTWAPVAMSDIVIFVPSF